MSETSTMIRQAETIRKGTISVLEGLGEKAGRFDLPKPPDLLEYYRKRLLENTYKVLVVGETNRGKSTFINALVGREILPTDVRVATSEVFNVRRAEREAYRLRFEDGSARKITREDLSYYGSEQSEKDGSRERLRLDQVIRWIEVDTPTARFLPEGVSLLDTPGTGSLYAHHALVTNRLVPEADAVVFVLDSSRPMVKTEMMFLDSVLGATPDVFFLQTKTNLFRSEEWKDTLRRNQQILQDNFGDRLIDMRIWPMDSVLLLEAPSPEEDREGFEEDLKFSRYEEVETALGEFLFRVVGWRRSAQAILEAGRYHSSSRATLSTRLAALEEDRVKRGEMRQRAADRMRRFEEDWGPKGAKRRELVEGIRRTAAQGQRSMSEALRTDGRVALAQKAKIGAVATLEEAENLNEQMPGDLVGATREEWLRLRELAEDRSRGSLGPFLAEANALVGQEGGTDDPDLAVRNRELQALGSRLWEPLRGDWKDYALVGVAATAILSTAAAPLAVAGAAVGLVGALLYGWRSGQVRQLEAAKAQLYENLDDVLRQVRARFLETDMESGRFGLVEEYFAAVERAMMDKVETIAARKEREARAEYERLAEAGKLDEGERGEKIEQARGQIAEWDTIGAEIEGTSARLNELDTPAIVPLPVAKREVEGRAREH